MVRGCVELALEGAGLESDGIVNMKPDACIISPFLDANEVASSESIN